MAADQDFSFPTINDSFSYSIDSPPLWNLSPAASPNPYGASFIKDNEDGKRRSFSCMEINGRRRRDDDDDDEKEKMDLLWEDFNEELMCSRTTTSSTSRDEEVEVRTVAKRSNNAALLLPAKNNSNSNRPGMVVFVKVLKKLFSLSNSQGKPRKRVAA